MTILESAVIGLVEGVTEYLPVSSTGHILLTQRWMGIEETEASNAYAIVIQAGAIAAVMLIYFGRFKQVFRGVFLGDASGRKLAINIMVAFLPAAVIGLSFNDAIEEHLFGLQPIVWAWFVGGLLILRVAARQKSRANEGIDLAGLTWQSALIIGFAQCVAMWPGTSRSLVTILGGTLIGLRLASAVEFSFLLGMVTLLAATAYSTLKSGAVMIEAYGIDCLLVGFATAGISAFIAVKWMVSYLNKNGLEIFGWYRIALAAVVFGLMYFGQL